MRKLLSLIISILFTVSVSGLCFAQAAPATSDQGKPVVTEKQETEKKTTKKTKKTKKSKKAKKPKKTDQETAPADKTE